jgi:hypothetical protein
MPRIFDDCLTRSNGAQKPYLVHGVVQFRAWGNHSQPGNPYGDVSCRQEIENGGEFLKPSLGGAFPSTLSKDAFQRRLEGVERENLNPRAGLRTSHQCMGDVSTIPEAGRQNPGSDKAPSSSASQDSTQPDELEGVMSLEAALVRTLQRLGAIW